MLSSFGNYVTLNLRTAELKECNPDDWEELWKDSGYCEQYKKI